MTKPPEIEADINRLYYAEHWRVGTIATQLGIHADVVRRVVGLDRDRPTAPMARPRRVDAYRDFIDMTLRQYPRLRSTLRRLCERPMRVPNSFCVQRLVSRSSRTFAPMCCRVVTETLVFSVKNRDLDNHIGISISRPKNSRYQSIYRQAGDRFPRRIFPL
jgi:hypothetical protein